MKHAEVHSVQQNFTHILHIHSQSHRACQTRPAVFFSLFLRSHAKFIYDSHTHTHTHSSHNYDAATAATAIVRKKNQVTAHSIHSNLQPFSFITFDRQWCSLLSCIAFIIAADASMWAPALVRNDRLVMMNVYIFGALLLCATHTHTRTQIMWENGVKFTRNNGQEHAHTIALAVVRSASGDKLVFDSSFFFSLFLLLRFAYESSHSRSTTESVYLWIFCILCVCIFFSFLFFAAAESGAMTSENTDETKERTQNEWLKFAVHWCD